MESPYILKILLQSRFIVQSTLRLTNRVEVAVPADYNDVRLVLC